MPFPASDRICPAPASPRGAFAATVTQNCHLCTDHFRLTLRLSHFPASTPGQFIQLDCRDPHAVPSPANHDIGPRGFDWPPPPGAPRPAVSDPDFIAPLAYLRRPFSIADRRDFGDGSTELDIIHRVVGRGTLLLAQLHPGLQVSLLGPLGVGFDIPPALEMACLVGGGVGIPPMIYLANLLATQRHQNVVAFLGALRHDLLPVTFTPPPDALPSSPDGDPVLNVEEFRPFGYPAVITTDDGSRGMKGFVTAALQRFLQQRRSQRGDLAHFTIYCCGPTPMMKATAKVAAEFAVPCQVSLEQPMACGMGTCQSCIIRYRTRGTPDADWKYKLTCTDGPVFDTRDILW